MDNCTNRAAKIKLATAIERLRVDLEKDFFAQVSIQDLDLGQIPTATELIIDISCNFGLTESLFHFNKGNWGNLKTKTGDNGLQKRFSQLCGAYECESVDIKELSIHLNDCSIIIGQLYPKSVVEHTANIFNAISENFFQLTKGLSEMPNEMYVPVFEEDKSMMPHTASASQKKNDYFNYWGLYYDYSSEMEVYGFKHKSLLKGDFYLVN